MFSPSDADSRSASCRQLSRIACFWSAVRSRSASTAFGSPNTARGSCSACSYRVMIMLPLLAPPGSRPPHLPFENPPPLVELGLVDLAPGEAFPEDVDRLIGRPGASRIGRAPAERSATQADRLAAGRTDRTGRVARQHASLRMASSPECHPRRRGRMAGRSRKEPEVAPKKILWGGGC